MPKQLYTASEAASALGISIDTLRRWDKRGRIKVHRDARNRRLVTAEERDRPGLHRRHVVERRGSRAPVAVIRQRIPATLHGGSLHVANQEDQPVRVRADKVVFVEATVDPGRDSVARLAAYQKEFGATWELWTGSATNLANFWKAFGVTYQVVPEAQPAHLDWYTGQPLTYDVDHTDEPKEQAS